VPPCSLAPARGKIQMFDLRDIPEVMTNSTHMT
jgi:hypothetical protein